MGFDPSLDDCKPGPHPHSDRPNWRPEDDAPPKRPAVTYLRHFSGRMSGSRNEDRPLDKYPEGTNGWLCDQPQSGDVCYYCRQRFSPDQLRYRIMQIVPGGWGPALLCMECFKSETDDSCLGYGADRHVIQCAGCGEHINTIRDPRHQHWNVCSDRCYQREYRKRRRGRLSVVEWKGGHYPRCQCCKKPIGPKRRDAQFCCNACRQKTYRRRRASPASISHKCEIDRARRCAA